MAASAPASNVTPRRYFELARHFAARELRERFLGSLSGGIWAVVQPVAQLLVLYFVFGLLLRVRLPNANAEDFLPFLVTGLWPWVAFSEGVIRGMAAIPERAALIAKVALPRSVLVLAPVLASFALHGVGFVAVLTVIALMGYSVSFAGLPVAVALWMTLAAFSFGFALALATLNVFVRDTAQVAPQLFMLWFYLTPIFYPISIIPGALNAVAQANPMTAFIGSFRAVLLGDASDPVRLVTVIVVSSLLALALGRLMFHRAARHFEDFL